MVSEVQPNTALPRRDIVSGTRSKLRGITWLQIARPILLVTCVAKLLTAAGANPLLEVADPIAHVKTRYLLLFAACAEATVLWYMTRRRSSDFNRAMLLGCLGWVFLFYKTLLRFRDPEHPCYCLGWLGKWLFLSERTIALATTLLACGF